MAFQYWRSFAARRRGRAFVSLTEAYHGDTIGSVSVGGIDLFHSTYRPLLFETLKVEPGRHRRHGAGSGRARRGGRAVIIEPLVQGAAGMLLQPPGYLRAVRELCDEHGVLLICDEVATGFGRTGTMFACEQEDVVAGPDLRRQGTDRAATCRWPRRSRPSAIYEGFLGAFEEFRTFFHGHTYTGNPLACAAAIATLDVFERSARSSACSRRSRCSPSCSSRSRPWTCREIRRAASWSGSSSSASRWRSAWATR
jgi:adenosylmethionine-8-amino-7-oxononanoate aminotransferase